MTLIRDADINVRVPFEEAVSKFRTWCSDDCVLITWSPSDVIMLEENLIVNNMDYEWIPECFDALFHFNIKPSGMHDALADA